MADGVAITAGSGTTILTDDTGAGGHAQVVKLAISADASGTLIPADAANGLDVDVTRLPSLVAGTANIGDVDVLTIAAGDNNIGNVDIVTMPDATVVGKAADGAAVSGNPVLIAGQDGTNVQSLKTDASGELQVDVLTLPNVTVGTMAALVAGTANIGDVDVLTVPADPFGANADAASATGSISAKLRFIAATGIPITSAPSTAVTNVGTFATQIDGSALTALQLIDDSVKADDAAFTVATDKVTMTGVVAVAHGANPDAADANDAVAALANRHRIPFTIGGHPNIITVRLQFTAAQTDVAVVTVGASTKIVVTAFQVTLDNASTVFPSVRLGFGTANTPTTTGVIGAHGGLPAGGGFGRGDGSGIIGIGADNEDLRITTVGTATGNGVEVVVTYYTIES